MLLVDIHHFRQHFVGFGLIYFNSYKAFGFLVDRHVQVPDAAPSNFTRGYKAEQFTSDLLDAVDSCHPVPVLRRL